MGGRERAGKKIYEYTYDDWCEGMDREIKREGGRAMGLHIPDGWVESSCGRRVEESEGEMHIFRGLKRVEQ